MQKFHKLYLWNRKKNKKFKSAKLIVVRRVEIVVLDDSVLGKFIIRSVHLSKYLIKPCSTAR